MDAPDAEHPTPNTARDQRSLIVLSVTAVLFLGRVLAQVIQAVAPVGWIPPFDAWQSGAIPYWLLLVLQVIVLGVQVWIIRRVALGRYAPSAHARRAIGVFGIVYLHFMTFRLIAGLTFLDGHPWFDCPLPSVFHIVLAVFVLGAARAGGAPDC